MKILPLILIFNQSIAFADQCSHSGWGKTLAQAVGNSSIYDISVGGFFLPTINSTSSLKFIQASGTTALYGMPNNIIGLSQEVSTFSNYTTMSGGAHWWLPCVSVAANCQVAIPAYMSVTGQNCETIIKTKPLPNTYTANIGGINVNVLAENGKEITTRTLSSATIPWNTPSPVRYFNLVMQPTVINLSSAGYVSISIPAGTPNGDYQGLLKLPYSTVACAGSYVCNHIDLNTVTNSRNSLSLSIKIKVFDGKPVNPDTYCNFDKNNINIDYGRLSIVDVKKGERQQKDGYLGVSCSAAKVPITLKILGQSFSSDSGIVVDLNNGLYSLLTLENGSNSMTTYVNHAAVFKIKSSLHAIEGNKIKEGKFSGSAVLSINYQ